MLTDDELFAEISLRRSEGKDFRQPLGELVGRWKDPSTTVVRRVQGAFMRGSPDDAEEIFQDAVGKFLSRGLEQFRGVSEQVPGKAASPKTFFLRIVVHCAIDSPPARSAKISRNCSPYGYETEDDVPEVSKHEAAQRRRRGEGQRREGNDAQAEYWPPSRGPRCQARAPERSRRVGPLSSPGCRRSRRVRTTAQHQRREFLQAREPRPGLAQALHRRVARASRDQRKGAVMDELQDALRGPL